MSALLFESVLFFGSGGKAAFALRSDVVVDVLKCKR